MKKIGKSTFWLVAIFVALLTLLALFGIDKLNLKGVQDIRFGIDIKGGVEVIYAPSDDFGRKPTNKEMESARSVLETRLDDKKILDKDITVDYNNGEVLVRFPWKSNETNFDPKAAIEELGETALLTFQDSSGNVLIDGSHVKDSSAVQDERGGYMVKLVFDSEGAKLFSEATAKLVGQPMPIYMDKTEISHPKVEERIDGDTAYITGLGSFGEAKELSQKINAGSLPFSLKAKSYSTITPTLGTEALNVMVTAGLLAFVLVCLFMLIYYRLSGFVACFALSLQVVCQLLLLSIPQFTLTLPGIAGIILSVGMGVDANIITSERIKEEIRDGVSVPRAIQLGYKRAFSAVFDGNMTAAIVAILLMIFGSGSILSFGYTLLTGVLLNLVSGITASKLMITSLSKYNFLNKPILYGDRRKKA